jgi:DNA processing protein
MPRKRPTSQRQPAVPKADKYLPPDADAVKIVRLATLLGGRRSVDDQQQHRFGFDDGQRLGPPLWCAGDTALIERPCVAIVGTRQVSVEGAARARRLARGLAERDVVIVSGLARGVDTEALNAAIEAGGRVVAVIGTPIDRAYPAENARLQENIYRDHLLVSQFAPGSRVFPSHFPERNKLMAALSDATVIIEAGEGSGTLHQAAECVRLGRALFIAENVLQNSALTWPATFTPYPNVHRLSRIEDVLTSL